MDTNQDTDTFVSIDSENEKYITIFVKSLTGQSIPIKCLNNGTVLNLKEAIESYDGIPTHLQRLIYGGNEIEDNKTLMYYNIHHESTIHMILRKVQVNNSQNFIDRDFELARRLQQNESDPDGNRSENNTYNGDHAPSGISNNDYAFPISVVNLPNEANSNNFNEHMLQLYHMSQVVRFFTIIDCILLITWSFSYLPFLSGVVLVLLGYVGAIKYRPAYIFVYILYIIASIGLRIYWCITDDSVYFIIVIICGIIIELYILKIVINFFLSIKNLSEVERQELASLSRFANNLGFN